MKNRFSKTFIAISLGLYAVVSFLLPVSAYAAGGIARDSTLGVQIANSGTSLTYSFNNVAGNMLIVIAYTDSNTPACTYNGVTMTKIGSTVAMVSNQQLSVFYLMNPATGTHNVFCNGFNTANQFARFFTQSYTGVNAIDQTSSTGGSGTTLSSSVTTTASNEWVIGGVGSSIGGSNTITGTSNLTTFNKGDVIVYNADSNGTVALGSITVSASLSGSSNWALIYGTFTPTVTSTPFNWAWWQDF